MGEVMKKTKLFTFIVGIIVGSFLSGFYFSIILKRDKTNLVGSANDCPTSPGAKILPPPKYSTKMIDPLETNFQGEVTLMWEEVPYAYRYNVRVYNPRGKLIRKWRTKYDVVYVKDLPYDKDKEFTEHTMTLTSINYMDQEGPESEKKILKARRLTNLLAPAIESVIIED